MKITYLVGDRIRELFRPLIILGARERYVLCARKGKPDHAFEAPTCKNRNYISFLHGKVGYIYSAR